MRLACLQSAAGFLRRPPFRGASGREVNSSRPATKSGLPSGRPVCVARRNWFTSAADSASAMNARHSAETDLPQTRQNLSSAVMLFPQEEQNVAMHPPRVSAAAGLNSREPYYPRSPSSIRQIDSAICRTRRVLIWSRQWIRPIFQTKPRLALPWLLARIALLKCQRRPDFVQDAGVPWRSSSQPAARLVR